MASWGTITASFLRIYMFVTNPLQSQCTIKTNFTDVGLNYTWGSSFHRGDICSVVKMGSLV